ncbi:MAG: sulfatase family protein [Planctomycetota bacterium]|jgi:arylsulfatase A-like enzyme
MSLKNLCACLLVIGGCSLQAQNTSRAQQSKTPNILIIMCDQLTPRVLSCYGGPVETPNIDRIAREGVRFTQATCPTPYCSPTRASFIMGVYPHTHGITQNVGSRQIGLNQDDITTEKILHADGYLTHFYGKWHLVKPKLSPDMPYYPDHYRQFPEYYNEFAEDLQKARELGPEHYQKWYEFYLPIEIWPKFQRAVEAMGDVWKDQTYAEFTTRMGRLKMPLSKHFDVRVTDLTVERIKYAHNRDKPFMVTCAINSPHDPYALPSPYYEMYDPEKIELPANRNVREKRFEQEWSRRLVADIDKPGMGHPSIREFLRIYYGSVRLIDDQVGRILKTLDQTGQTDNTLILFTSDHGDMVGGHGMAWKSTTAFYEEVVSVPLIIRYPRLFKPRVNNMAVDHVDFMPTILDLLGKPIPDYVQGQSLIPYLTGKRDPATAYPYKFSERIHRHPKQKREILPTTKGSFMIRGNGWKYIRYHDSGEYMYNLKADPGEVKNLINNPQHQNMRTKLANELNTWLKRTGWKGAW